MGLSFFVQPLGKAANLAFLSFFNPICYLKTTVFILPSVLCLTRDMFHLRLEGQISVTAGFYICKNEGNTIVCFFVHWVQTETCMPLSRTSSILRLCPDDDLWLQNKASCSFPLPLLCLNPAWWTVLKNLKGILGLWFILERYGPTVDFGVPATHTYGSTQLHLLFFFL